MAKLEIEELGRSDSGSDSGSDSVIVQGARSVEVVPDHVGEDLRNVLPEIGAEKQTDSLDE